MSKPAAHGFPQGKQGPFACTELPMAQALPAGLRDSQELSRAGRSSACELYSGASCG